MQGAVMCYDEVVISLLQLSLKQGSDVRKAKT